MKILYATSEAVPFCKTGGLADVAGSLPAAQRWRWCCPCTRRYGSGMAMS